MDQYERNLKRLQEAKRLLSLATKSGTLKDNDVLHPETVSCQLARAAEICLGIAVKNQAVYVEERRKPVSYEPEFTEFKSR